MPYIWLTLFSLASARLLHFLTFKWIWKKNEDNKIQFRIFSHNFENKICNLSFGNPLDSKTINYYHVATEIGEWENNKAWGKFLEVPCNYWAHLTVLFSIPDESFKRFETCTVKLLAKETKWRLLEVRTHPTLLKTLLSKYDFRPIKLPGLSRNEPTSKWLVYKV